MHYVEEGQSCSIQLCKIDIYKYEQIYTNTYNDKNQYTVRHVQYIQSNHQLNLSYALKCVSIQQRYNVRVSTNQLIQHHISPQLEFKLNLLNIPSGVTILWAYIFHVRPHLTMRYVSIMKNYIYIFFIKKVGVGIATYFCLFLKQKTK